MRIGVVSDTHDRAEVIADAIRLLQEQHVELILHCGDIESPDTARLFKPIPTHFVFGNWDKERSKLAAAIKDAGGTHYDSFGAITLADKRLAWVHSHERHQLRQLEHSDYFDYLFYGHTHVREQHRTGKTLVANPGALFRANPKTCIVLDEDRRDQADHRPRGGETVRGGSGSHRLHPEMPALESIVDKPAKARHVQPARHHCDVRKCNRGSPRAECTLASGIRGVVEDEGTIGASWLLGNAIGWVKLKVLRKMQTRQSTR